MAGEMKPARLEGVVPILVTPFDETGGIDEESLSNLVAFNIAAGVHGLGIALGSEVFKFNEAERDRVVSTVVSAVAGRVPVVVNTGAAGTALATFYSRRAEALGADAVMVIPPNFAPVDADGIAAYYRAISEAVAIPIVLQDVPQAPIPPPLALRIARECEHARYIKVETPPVAGRVADMVSAAGEALTIFGGAGGGYFIEEVRRGSRGTMPFCTQPEIYVAIWAHLRAGRTAEAEALFAEKLSLLLRLGQQGGYLYYHLHKQLLVRQGVIRTAHVRGPTMRIDATTQGEIDALLEALVPVAMPYTAF